MAIVVYEKRTCTTCRKLAELLEQHGIDFERVEYHVERLTEGELRGLVAKTGVPARELLRLREEGARRAGRRRRRHRRRGDGGAAELLQRPVVVDGDRAVLARPVERVLEIL